MIALLLMSCGPPRAKPPVPSFEGTADTGTTSVPVTTGGPSAREFLAPSARITPTDELAPTGLLTILPASGGQSGLILVKAWSDAFGDPFFIADPTLVVRGDLGPGDHDLAEHWDGTIWFADIWPFGTIVPAGDVDVDGHLDLWFGQHLLRGPILGIDVDIDAGSPRILATLNGEEPVAGDVDLDGDGIIDVIAQSDRGNDAYIHYGPFAGSIPSARLEELDPGAYSSFGGVSCDSLPAAFWLRDRLGPGRDLVAIGSDVGNCSTDAYLWDPFVPRGTHLATADAVASFDYWSTVYVDVALWDVGDVDGDGHPDAIYEYSSSAQILPGPLSGHHGFPADHGFDELVLHGDPSRAMPDINGDGLPEILAEWDWTEPEGTDPGRIRTWVLMCSPHPLPLDLSTGIPLVQAGTAGSRWISSFLARPAFDLDGDGLVDLVDLVYVDYQPDHVAIWYGADLAAACAAQQSPSE